MSKQNKKLSTAFEYIFSKIDDSAVSYLRLTSLLYLIDWKYALENNGKTLSQLSWQLKDFSPHTKDIVEKLEQIKSLSINRSSDDEKSWIVKFEGSSAKRSYTNKGLNSKDKRIIDYVANISINKNIDELINYTYPLIRNSTRYEKEFNINLSDLARDYKANIKPNLKAA